MSRAADLAALIVDVNTTEAKTDELTGKTTAGSIAVTGEGGSTTTNLQQGLTKAWCSWDMDSSVGIADSFNISSITDSNADKNRLFFTNNMSIADGQSTTGGFNANGAGKDNVGNSDICLHAPRTTEISFQSMFNDDPAFACIHVLGDLA